MKKFLEKGPGIVITTQLIEAGVNVSFDAMIREVAPLDSLIQSAGRVNRYKESNKPKPIYIFATETILPYRKHQIEITSNLLKNWQKSEHTETLYYEELMNYWSELNNWIIKDENEADKILRHRKQVSPFGVKLSEEEINFRGGYITISAVPQRYIDDVIQLLEKREKVKDIWEKRKLLAKVENYMVEVPFFGKATKFGQFKDYIEFVDKEKYPWLNMLTLKYDKVLGVMPEEDNII